MTLLQLPEAGLSRRLAALVYEALLLLALLIAAATPFVLLLGGPPRLGGHGQVLQPLFQLYLVAVTATFYVWFWSHGGQTLAQRAWRLKVVREDGHPLRPGQALLRLVLACAGLGLGLLWVWVDRDRRSAHDRWCGTRLVVTPKP